MQSTPTSPIHGFAQDDIPAFPFNWPPISPVEYTPGRTRQPLARGRPQVRLSARERWIVRRIQTEPADQRQSLSSVPEDRSLTNVASSPDISTLPANLDHTIEVFETPKGEPDKPPRGRRRTRAPYTGPRRRSSRVRSSASSGSRDPHIGSARSLDWDSTEEVPSFLEVSPRTLNNRTQSTQFSLSALEQQNLSQVIQGLIAEPPVLLPPALVLQPVTPPRQPRQVTMAAEDAQARIPEMIERLELLIETYKDDYADYNPDELDSMALQRYSAGAITDKQELQTLLLKLPKVIPDNEHKELLVQGTEAKRGLITFIRAANKSRGIREVKEKEAQAAEQLRQLELTHAREAADEARRAVEAVNRLPDPPPAPPDGQDGDQERPNNPRVKGLAIKRRRVRENTEPLVTEVETLVDELTALTLNKPEGNASYEAYVNRVDTIKVKTKSVLDDCKNLLSDAIDIDMEADIMELDTKYTTLKKTERTLYATLQDVKDSYGPIRSLGRSDVPPPKFSGRPGEGLDYYSFVKEWNDYSDSKVVSKSELVRLLTLKCLEGPAKIVCHEVTSVAEAMERLKTSYGNVRHLFDQKAKEIAKLGQCKGNASSKRDWICEMEVRLKAIRKLATDHDILSRLHHSDIPALVEHNITSDMRKDFLDHCMAVDKDCLSTAEAQFERLVEYLGVIKTKLTYVMNHEVNHGRNLFSESESAKTPKPVQNSKPNQVKNVPAKPPSGGKGFTVTPKTVQAASKKVDNIAHNVKNRVHISASYVAPKEVKCLICDKNHTHMFYCLEFQKNSFHKVRAAMCYKTRSCFRCLRLDAGLDMDDRAAWWKTHEKDCQTDWYCDQGGCPKREKPRQFHFLMCSWHTDQNKLRALEFTKTLPKELVTPTTKFYYSFPGLYATLTPPSEPFFHKVDGFTIEPDIYSPPIFMLQYITVNERQLLLFYDSGCMTSALSDRAAIALESVCVEEGPTNMCVAGGDTIHLEGGHEQFILRLSDDKSAATVTGLRMPHVTTPFPEWDVDKAWSAIESEWKSAYPDASEPLPKHPSKVGGVEVDIIIGIKYARYFPELLYTLPSGLGIYKSKIAATNGESCVLGGPHDAFRDNVNKSYHLGVSNFFTSDAKAFYEVNPWIISPPDPKPLPVDDEDTPLEFFESCGYVHCTKHGDEADWIIPAHWDLERSAYGLKESAVRFGEAEMLGSEISYRCVRCRNCQQCRQGEQLEMVSLKEEVEQLIIEDSVEFLPAEGKLQARLPFIQPPEDNLLPNRRIAEKVLESQLKQTSACEQKRLDVIASHEKLRSKGYVRPLSELTAAEQASILEETAGTYYIPWRVVHKEGSLSTPTRMVFDASSKTPGGESLNNCLAKGANTLANLNGKLLQFRSQPDCFAADIRMAYNGVSLHPSHYRYQLYLWREDLDPDSPVIVMVVMTIIYGVRPSGNQLGAGLGKLADYTVEFYPQHAAGALALKNSSYVDDVLKACINKLRAKETAKSLSFTLSLANMSVKAFTFNGEPPPSEVSADGKTIGLIGHIWEPETDLIGPDIKPLYLEKMKRGKMPDPVEGDVGEALMDGKFTRRVLLGKVAQVYDPTGLLTPITSRFKLHLHDLCIDEQLGWDDKVPEKYLDQWVRNLDDIQLLKTVRFQRTVIPVNAANLNINLIVTSDASKSIAVATVHARVLLTDGSYSCQLFTARSKLVKTSTIPKAELRGAVMAASLGHVVKYNLGPQYEGAIYCSDSTIALYWIVQDQRALETYVRNCVIEVRRFTDPSQWYHVASEDNIADLGTRTAEVSEIGLNTDWQTGRGWMKDKFEDMPIRTIQELTLSNEERRLAAQESKIKDVSPVNIPMMHSRTAERYQHSGYVVDPNRFSWPKVLRVMSIVLKFASSFKRNFKPIWQPPKVGLDEYSTEQESRKKSFFKLSRYDLQFAENYFFSKCTSEVKKFSPLKELKERTITKNGILYYCGRIMDSTQINCPNDPFLDIEPLSFVRPVVDRYSPCAYSIMSHAHIRLARHKGINFTIRESRTIAYVLRGRDLAIEVDQSCRPCVKFKSRLLKAEMGPVHESRLTIAPPFHTSQVDIFGPYLAKCQHNHRSTVKIYGLVFKCPATCAIAINAMQDYSTTSFLQAYTRFGSRYGHPSHLAIDQGSQLLSAVQNMQLSIQDVTGELFSKYEVGIKYTTCPVSGHNAHGQVERGIKEVKALLERCYTGFHMDVLTIETAFQWIAAELNNIPICIGSKTDNLEYLDIITPSRLLLGRNNRRALSGYAKVEKPSKMLQQMEAFYDAWWTGWNYQKICDFIPRSGKWPRTSNHIKVGDIVIYLKQAPEQHFGEAVWKIGRVMLADPDEDGICRHITIEYKNPSENVFRRTTRAVRSVAVVHREDDLDIVQQMEVAKQESDQLAQADQLLQSDSISRGSNPSSRPLYEREVQLAAVDCSDEVLHQLVEPPDVVSDPVHEQVDIASQQIDNLQDTELVEFEESRT